MSRKSLFVNALTFARIPLVFGWFLFAILSEYSHRIELWGAAACVSLTLVGLTDAFDGALARRWGVVSTLGKMSDPLMDKVFYVVVFPTLAWLIQHTTGNDVHALVMLLFAIFYILRDLWVTFLRSVGALYGADGAAMWLGKVRTALSFPVAGLIYLYVLIYPLLSESNATAGLFACYALEGVMILLNFISFFTYTCKYWVYVKRAMGKNISA